MKFRILKIILFSLLLFFLFIGSPKSDIILSPCAFGPELISNGGMEIGNPPTNTYVIDAPDTFERSGVQKHSGSYSCHVADPAIKYCGFYLSEATNVKTAGYRYQLSFWVYVLSGRITVDMLNGNFSEVLDTKILTSAPSWQFVELRGTEDVTGNTILRATNDSPTEVPDFYVDDVSMKQMFCY